MWLDDINIGAPVFIFRDFICAYRQPRTIKGIWVVKRKIEQIGWS